MISGTIILQYFTNRTKSLDYKHFTQCLNLEGDGAQKMERSSTFYCITQVFFIQGSGVQILDIIGLQLLDIIGLLRSIILFIYDRTFFLVCSLRIYFF